MRFQLPTDVAITWEASDRIRIGCTLHSVTVAESQLTHDLIDQLRTGAELALLRGIVDSSDSEPHCGHRLLDELLSCCERTDADAATLRACIRTTAAAEPLARRIAAELTHSGCQVFLGGADAPLHRRADFVIEVCDRAIAPRRYLEHLSNDRLHLLVTRDTKSITIGPFVVPGATPCIRCNELARLASDPAWLLTATQLLDQPAPACIPELELVTALELGMWGTMLRRSWRERTAQGRASRMRFAGSREVLTPAARSVLPVVFQPECGCRIPAESETADRVLVPTTGSAVFELG